MYHQIRAVTSADYDSLLELSTFLNSVNLPHDPQAIGDLVRLSEDSFSGQIKNPAHREYIFVIEDLREKILVGTSMVIAQLGRKDAPYIYFDIHREERYSATLDKHFVHDVLTVRFSYSGPTEIGGLVVHPDYRRTPEKIGQLISYVRFLWIAMHRSLVRDQILAELLPPFGENRTSYLWEAVGRRFTDMSYREADHLSKRNKEFIRSLFPREGIYASLLSPEAQAVIGKVGPQTQGVEHMLRRIGFRYANRVDPFDGGPHFVAATDEITLVQRSQEREVALARGEAVGNVTAMLARTYPEAPFFKAVVSQIDLPAHGPVGLPQDAAEALMLQPHDTCWLLPLG